MTTGARRGSDLVPWNRTEAVQKKADIANRWVHLGGTPGYIDGKKDLCVITRNGCVVDLLEWDRGFLNRIMVVISNLIDFCSGRKAHLIRNFESADSLKDKVGAFHRRLISRGATEERISRVIQERTQGVKDALRTLAAAMGHGLVEGEDRVKAIIEEIEERVVTQTAPKSVVRALRNAEEQATKELLKMRKRGIDLDQDTMERPIGYWGMVGAELLKKGIITRLEYVRLSSLIAECVSMTGEGDPARAAADEAERVSPTTPLGKVRKAILIYLESLLEDRLIWASQAEGVARSISRGSSQANPDRAPVQNLLETDVFVRRRENPEVQQAASLLDEKIAAEELLFTQIKRWREIPHEASPSLSARPCRNGRAGSLSSGGGGASASPSRSRSLAPRSGSQHQPVPDTGRKRTGSSGSSGEVERGSAASGGSGVEPDRSSLSSSAPSQRVSPPAPLAPPVDSPAPPCPPPARAGWQVPQPENIWEAIESSGSY